MRKLRDLHKNLAQPLPTAAASAWDRYHRSRSHRSLSRGNTLIVHREREQLKRNPVPVPKQLKIRLPPRVRPPPKMLKPPAAYKLYAQHHHDNKEAPLSPREIQSAWQQLGRPGRAPFRQSTADARAQLDAPNTPSVPQAPQQPSSSLHSLTPELAALATTAPTSTPGTQQQPTRTSTSTPGLDAQPTPSTAAEQYPPQPSVLQTLTPELAIVASASRRAPTGYWHFHDEMSLHLKETGTRIPLLAFNQSMSTQWKGLTTEQREPYMQKGDGAVKVWLAQRADINTRLRACGHAALSQTSVRAVRMPSASDLYIQKLPPELAAAVTAHARRSPYGYSVFLQEFAGKLGDANFTKHRTTRAVCRAAAARWIRMSAEARQPYLQQAAEGQVVWLEQRALLNAQLKAAGFPPFVWNTVKPRPSHPHKKYVQQLPPA
ncbi:MAG: hypothetical protein WDW38_010379 [Sanguina aurantia]